MTYRAVKLLILFAALLLFFILTACTDVQTWCDDNPKACRVAVVAGGACVVAAVSLVAVGATHSGPATVRNP